MRRLLILFIVLAFAAVATSATITPSWTENQTVSGFDDAAIAAAGTTSGDIDMAASGYDVVVIQIKVTFGGTPDGDATIEIFASSDSGTTDDTIALYSISVSETATTTERISITIDRAAFLQVKVTNNDSADTIDVSALYAGRKWSSI